MTVGIVVHGGAGLGDASRVADARAGAERAVRTGLLVLAQGGAALEAVQAAVRVLEDDPEFNAGVGAALTRDGTVELDAAIMDGASLRIGAIAAVENARRPIDLARLVLEDGEQVLLCGPAAWDFARERGLGPVDASELTTERARRRLASGREKPGPGAAGGTVGACAIDRGGHVATATSTGGISGKRRGRVGDTPLAGCGTYADDRAGAASATGHGEAIIRVGMARTVIERLRQGMEAGQAAWQAVDELAARVAGVGGVICVDARGRFGVAHNSQSMTYGHATLDRPEPVTGVEVIRG